MDLQYGTNLELEKSLLFKNQMFLLNASELVKHSQFLCECFRTNGPLVCMSNSFILQYIIFRLFGTAEYAVMVMETPSPQCVGREFVRQYYTLLHEAPLHLHRYRTLLNLPASPCGIKLFMPPTLKK